MIMASQTRMVFCMLSLRIVRDMRIWLMVRPRIMSLLSALRFWTTQREIRSASCSSFGLFEYAGSRNFISRLLYRFSISSILSPIANVFFIRRALTVDWEKLLGVSSKSANKWTQPSLAGNPAIRILLPERMLRPGRACSSCPSQ